MLEQCLIICILLFLLGYKAEIVRWNEHYIDKDNTATINGFFIWIVFMSHFAQYCKDSYMNLVNLCLGQLVVVMFLFYSGYGCARQITTYGFNYFRSFPKKRILQTLLNFDIAVLSFVIIGLMIGMSYEVKKIVLSLVCWESVGNSNWYIFVILICYVAIWISFGQLFHKMRFKNRQMLLVGIIACFALMLQRVKPPWWSDTMITFAAGVVYGLNKGAIERFIRKNYLLCFLLVAIMFLIIPKLPLISSKHFVMFNLKSIAFAILVVLVTTKLKVNSPILYWSGKHLFPLYIYQRIPMIVLSTLHPAAFMDWRRWVYFVVCSVITIFIAWGYAKVHIRI